MISEHLISDSFNDLLHCYNDFPLHFSGLLTGKYKKQNGQISATTGRLSYASNVGYKSTQSCPALSSYENDESYWNLMATLEKISSNHGNI